MQFTRNKLNPVIVANASKEEIALNNNNINRTCLCCNEIKNLDKFFQNEELRTNREVVCMSCCSKLVTDVDNFSLSDFKELIDKIINNDYVVVNDEYADDVKTTRDLVTNMYKDLIKPKKPSKSEVGEGEMYYENSRWVNINKETFTKSIEKGTELTNYVSNFNDLSINSKLIDGVLYFSVRDSYEMLEVPRETFNQACNNILGDKIFEVGGIPTHFNSPLIYKIPIITADNKTRFVEHISLSLLNEVVFRTHSVNSSKIKEFVSELITNYQVKGYVLDEDKLSDDNNYKLLGEVRTKSLELSNLPHLVSKIDDLASKTRMCNILLRGCSDYYTLNEINMLAPSRTNIDSFTGKVQNLLYGALFGMYSFSICARKIDMDVIGLGIVQPLVHDYNLKKEMLVAINFLDSEEISKMINLRNHITDCLKTTIGEIKGEYKIEYVFDLIEKTVFNITGFDNKLNSEKLMDLNKKDYEKLIELSKEDIWSYWETPFWKLQNTVLNT